MQHELDRHQDGHFQRDARQRPQGHRNAEGEQGRGRGRRREEVEKFSIAVGGSILKAAAVTPMPAEISNGLSTMPRAASRKTREVSFTFVQLAIMHRHHDERERASNEKIRATGAAAAGPRVASARPGPM